MPSVLFWPGIGGGTKHYRCLTPGAALARAGWDVTYVEDDAADFNVDVVVLQRVLHPDLPVLIERLHGHGVTVVYDIDDWYDNIPHYNPFRPGDHLHTLHASLAAADLITVSTPALADGYARFGSVAVLPNFIDLDLWTLHRTPSSAVRVGWMGHFDHRTRDVDLLVPWLADWLERTGCQFVNAGSGPELAEHLGVPIRRPSGPALRPYEQLPALLGNFDIGLVPLARNHFNDCKSWCKGLEYNAAGAAVVASPAAEYRTFIEPGVNGHLVDRQRWTAALDRTLDDLDAMQAGARQVAGRYVIDDHIGRWSNAYEAHRLANA